MFMEERQQQIAETINNEGRVSITAITEKYNISDTQEFEGINVKKVNKEIEEIRKKCKM